MAGKVSSKLYVRRMILAHLMEKRILKRQCIDILDVYETNVFLSQLTLKSTHTQGDGGGGGGGGGGVIKREISRLRVKLPATNSQGKRLKAMSVSLASVPVVRRSIVLPLLFNVVSPSLNLLRLARSLTLQKRS